MKWLTHQVTVIRKHLAKIREPSIAIPDFYSEIRSLLYEVALLASTLPNALLAADKPALLIFSAMGCGPYRPKSRKKKPFSLNEVAPSKKIFASPRLCVRHPSTKIRSNRGNLWHLE